MDFSGELYGKENFYHPFFSLQINYEIPCLFL